MSPPRKQSDIECTHRDTETSYIKTTSGETGNEPDLAFVVDRERVRFYTGRHIPRRNRTHRAGADHVGPHQLRFGAGLGVHNDLTFDRDHNSGSRGNVLSYVQQAMHPSFVRLAVERQHTGTISPDLHEERNRIVRPVYPD